MVEMEVNTDALSPCKKKPRLDVVAAVEANAKACVVQGDNANAMYLNTSSDPMSIDWMSTVASFLDTGKDLMNVLLAVGPEDAVKIRNSYLHDNDRYLVKMLYVILATPTPLPEVELRRAAVGARYCLGRAHVHAKYDRVRDNITLWMDANSRGDEGWRTRINAKKLKRHRRFRLEADNFFNNLALASSIGLVDVVRHLVEVVGVDVSDKRWRSPTYKSSPIELAIIRWDFRVVQCLLSSDTLNLEGPGYHKAIRIAILSPDVSQERLRKLATHPRVDVNATFANEDNYRWSDGDERSMLMIAVRGAIDAMKVGAHNRSKILVDKIDALLDIGADPALPLPGDENKFGIVNSVLQLSAKVVRVAERRRGDDGEMGVNVIKVKDEEERINLRQGWGTIVEKLKAQG